MVTTYNEHRLWYNLCIEKNIKKVTQTFSYRAELTRKKKFQKPKERRKPTVRLVSTWAESEGLGPGRGERLELREWKAGVSPSNDKGVGDWHPLGRQSVWDQHEVGRVQREGAARQKDSQSPWLVKQPALPEGSEQTHPCFRCSVLLQASRSKQVYGPCNWSWQNSLTTKTPGVRLGRSPKGEMASTSPRRKNDLKNRTQCCPTGAAGALPAAMTSHLPTCLV